MGVPVISLAGVRHVSRVGYSLLTNVGHPEWIARNWDDYVAKAASLAADAPQLARLRRGLRDEMQRSVVFAAEAQAARFAEAMIEMVRRGPRQS
jgi:predicted O-linked N-acetylglucosamine transferase (SPINDLY family)